MTYRLLLLCSAGALTTVMPVHAFAQTNAAASPIAADAADSAVDDIIVTGSRVARSGFDAPTPTKMLSTEQFQARGLANVGDFLGEIPAFRASSSASTNPQNSGGSGQNFADLRGLGNIRTLTLVDGRRHVPTSANGQVDLNLIPTILINRVEVVTGGASAAWGSDAVSGVVNIILDKRMQGLRGDISYGITQYGDNAERQISLAYGTDFADGRGHFVIGGDYVNASGIDTYWDRDWGREQHGLVTYPSSRPAGTPSRMWARGVTQINQAYGGVITGVNADTNPNNGADVLRGLQFGPGGALIPFTYGEAVGSNAINFSGGNDGLNQYTNLQAVVPVERYVGMAHLEYELSDAITVFAEGSYGKSGANFTAPTARDAGNGVTIRRDNYFIPDALDDILTTNAINSFGVARFYNDFGRVNANNQNETYRILGGASGDLGGSWSWDAYFQYGRNQFDARIHNHRIEQNFRYAVDAIEDPLTGDPMCRDAGARAQGCQPINIFGVGSPSQAAIDYVTGTQSYRVKTTQRAAAANLNGQPFETWAGPVSMALGVEYRKESADAVSDPIAQASGFNYGNPKAFKGSYEVKDAYVETVVPLAREMPFAYSLELNGAVRFTDYSTSGGVRTWKIGGTYEPVPDLKLRATRSRDVRAPNNNELFSSTNSSAQLRNPVTGITTLTRVSNIPNPGLRPEEADTLTFGAVFSPTFLDGFRLSVDYYDIKIGGVITALDAPQILDNCGNELRTGTPGFFCGFVDITGSGANTVIDGVNVQLLNLASLRARGIDFDASYRLRLGSGSLITRLAGTYAIDLKTDNGEGVPVTYDANGVIQNRGSVINRAGQVGGFTSGANSGATNTPHWVLNGSITYAGERLTGTLQGRYVGGGAIDKALVGPDSSDYNPASPISIANNRVDDRFYLNMSLQYLVTQNGPRKLSFYGVVNNLTNVDPPFPAQGVSGVYDRFGRTFKVGARFVY